MLEDAKLCKLGHSDVVLPTFAGDCNSDSSQPGAGKPNSLVWSNSKLHLFAFVSVHSVDTEPHLPKYVKQF